MDSYLKRKKLQLQYKKEKKSHEPFQSYLLTGQAQQAIWAESLYIFFKYETIVSRNGLSLGYSEQDTSSVCYACAFTIQYRPNIQALW